MLIEKPPQKFDTMDGSGSYGKKISEKCADGVEIYDETVRMIAEVVISKGVEYGLIDRSQLLCNITNIIPHPQGAGTLNGQSGPVMALWRKNWSQWEKETRNRTLIAASIIPYLYSFPYVARDINGMNSKQIPDQNGVDCTHYCQTSEATVLARMWWHRIARFVEG